MTVDQLVMSTLWSISAATAVTIVWMIWRG
jgi:hypothetical protein